MNARSIVSQSASSSRCANLVHHTALHCIVPQGASRSRCAAPGWATSRRRDPRETTRGGRPLTTVPRQVACRGRWRVTMTAPPQRRCCHATPHARGRHDGSCRGAPRLHYCIVNCIVFHTIPYHSIPFHSIPFHSIPFHSIPFHARGRHDTHVEEHLWASRAERRAIRRDPSPAVDRGRDTTLHEPIEATHAVHSFVARNLSQQTPSRRRRDGDVEKTPPSSDSAIVTTSEREPAAGGDLPSVIDHP